MTKYLLLASLALASASPAFAVVIPGLFNTGTDTDNVALVGGDGLTDTHYRIVQSTNPAFVGQQAVTFAAGTYAAEDADSRWISISASGGPSFTTSVYRLSFDLTGLDHSSAMITGRFGSDNSGRIFLNDQDTGIDAVSQFVALTSFTLDRGFVAGVNTLDFRVADFGGPTALRVDDLAGTIRAVDAIPEPASWAMMIGGFGLLGGAARQRRRPAMA